MNLLAFLRHGPTTWNREQRIQGCTDIALDRASFDPQPWQRLLNHYGPWHLLVSSPLIRCQETARLLMPTLPLQCQEGLREQDWGHWTGCRLRDLYQSQTQAALIHAQEQRGWAFTPPGGESRNELRTRVLTAIARVTAGLDGQRILFITHQGVIKALLNHLHNSPYLPGNAVPIHKRALHLLQQQGDALSLLTANIRPE